MTRRKLFISILLFLVYAAIVWFGAGMVVSGTNFFLVVFVLLTLGLTVLIVYLLISRAQRVAAPLPAAGGVSEADRPAPVRPVSGDDPEVAALAALINEANQRLARSPKLASRRVKTSVTRLPLFLLGGTEGAGKTSTFLKSGLEPELLAGQVFRDANIVPTRLANLWYAEDCLFAEISGGLFSGDAGRWSALLARLQGRSAGGFFKQVFGGKRRAQLRGFVLFCDIAPFLGVPDPGRMGGLSRRIQERLRAVGESFGTNFPVYLIFTKSDGVPYFSEYFARLVENEDQQILGCTVPAAAPGARGAEVFAESETARLSETFNNLYYSLAEKRLVVLPRESNTPQRPVMYEFPRELKRIRDTLVQFMVDVFRPNPLQPGPILRGFYFTGTRQVAVSALSPVMSDAAVARAAAGEATSLFNLADYQKKMGLVAAAAVSPSETTVERWCFTTELFHRVVLPDPMGQAVAYASRRNDMYRRIAFGALCFFAFVLCVLWVRSWVGNAGLLGDVETAARAGYSFQPNMRAVPSLETLKGMEALREQLETLLDYDRKGAPWRLRWGLYAGNRAEPVVYKLYFQRFRQVFFDDMQSSILGTLLRLPASPDNTNTYNGTYDRVKAHRMVTQGKCTPNPPFLTPVLSDIWLTGRTVDPDRQALAQKQIAFYAGELKYKNPYTLDENTAAIDRGRAYLSSFGGVERLYRGIIEEANKMPREPARLAVLAPNYKQVLITPGEVQAAFTRDGKNFVIAAIKDPSRMSLGEPCVVGVSNAGAQLLQSEQIQTDLQNLYVQDYINRWKAFTGATNVDSFRNVADASKKLEILADNRSPLLAEAFMVADNTNFPAPANAVPPAAATTAANLAQRFGSSNTKKAMDVAKQVRAAVPSTPTATPGDITRVFQPSREVVVVTDPDRLVNDPNRQYMNALAELQRAMSRLVDDRPANPDMSLHDAARKATDAGMDSVRQIAGRFNIASSQGVDKDFQRILEQPFRESLKFIITDPSKAGREGAGGAVKKFCARLLPIQRKFPFNPSSDTDASAAEVSAIFAPQGSALADMQQALAKLIVKQGNRWAANPASQDVHPTADLIAFMNKMQQIQDTLFSGGSTDMKMTYSLKPVPEQNVEAITLSIDGHSTTATKSSAQAQQFSWPGSGQVSVSVKAGGNYPFGAYQGTWAVWRWMYDADPRTGGNTMQWSTVKQLHGQPQRPTDAQEHPIVMKVEVPSGGDVFDRNFFNIRCPAKVAE
jgi:type VI secretion system protein ImpL